MIQTRLERQMEALQQQIKLALEGERRRKTGDIRSALEQMAVIIERAKTDQIDPDIHSFADDQYTQRRKR